MKNLIGIALIFSLSALHAQDDAETDSTGLPGDHFSLEIALDLFSKSESIEEFEKKINQEDNRANNLDINGDGEIDYVRVIDYVDGSDHALTLQVPVSETESQDIAVIEIEKNGEESAVVQIVGDEELYGEERYVEPADEKASGGKGGPSAMVETRGIVVNVWFWPSVRFIYGPAYRPWVSPWRWRHYPGYWKPWRPFGWRAYYGYCRPYHMRYHVVTVHRCTRAHVLYKNNRVHSPAVHVRYKEAHVRHKSRVQPQQHAGKSRKEGKAHKSPGKQKVGAEKKGGDNTRSGGAKGGGRTPKGKSGGNKGGGGKRK